MFTTFLTLFFKNDTLYTDILESSFLQYWRAMNIHSLVKRGILIPVEEAVFSFSSLSLDSRKAEKGGLFIAIPGQQQNGASFIDAALHQGANGIVVPQEQGRQFKDKHPEISVFETSNIRQAASVLASHFYPQQPDTLVAVTGTNGKTSVVSFTRQIWHHLGKPAASLGTLGLVMEGEPLPSSPGTDGINTPNPLSLHCILTHLKKEGIENVAFEASSHGLHQHRLDSVRLQAAVFTNFSNDHLDYHQTLEAYFEAKARLFSDILKPGAFPILNTDIPEYEKLVDLCTTRGLHPLTFGKEGNLVRLLSLTPKEEGQDIVLECVGKSYALSLPFVGQFQIYNIMAALSAVIACGAPADQAVQACLSLKGIPGRLEHVAPGVYVDYAHSPDALLSTLKALRPHTKGKLWLVFGCGGNRDPFKRPMMGEVASQFADKIIITDDNPRHEDPAEIRKQILAACPGAMEISPREHAIQTAVTGMQPGDFVLLAGKGHEPYQIIGNQVLPFHDREEAKKWVKNDTFMDITDGR